MVDGSDVAGGLVRLAAVRRPIEELRFVVVGAYVADCFVNTPRLPAWVCCSKIGSWAVNCAISDVKRLARTR